MEMAGFSVRLALGGAGKQQQQLQQLQQGQTPLAYQFVHFDDGSSLAVRPAVVAEASSTSCATPAHDARLSPCLLLAGEGQLEVPFPRPIRLSGGEATMEMLLRVDALPAKGERAFLMGCSGAYACPCVCIPKKTKIGWMDGWMDGWMNT